MVSSEKPKLLASASGVASTNSTVCSPRAAPTSAMKSKCIILLSPTFAADLCRGDLKGVVAVDPDDEGRVLRRHAVAGRPSGPACRDRSWLPPHLPPVGSLKACSMSIGPLRGLRVEPPATAGAVHKSIGVAGGHNLGVETRHFSIQWRQGELPSKPKGQCRRSRRRCRSSP